MGGWWRTPGHGGTPALLELRHRPPVATVLEVAGPPASGRRAGNRQLRQLRVALPSDLDSRRLADHRVAPTGEGASRSRLSDIRIVGASVMRTTLPPQRPQSVSIVGSRNRPLVQSWPHVSQMRVGGFPAIGAGPFLDSSSWREDLSQSGEIANAACGIYGGLMSPAAVRRRPRAPITTSPLRISSATSVVNHPMRQLTGT
jgi:hypothetical protein